jgi:Ca2+:H+ antiporter
VSKGGLGAAFFVNDYLEHLTAGFDSMPSSHHSAVPAWTWIAPAAACILLALKMTKVVNPDAVGVLILAGILLAGAIFAAVHHAEVLALKLGEPFGSVLLAVSVTVIEVALIVSIQATGAPGSDAVARDTVFSAVMIVLNGIIGLCLVLGAGRHYEQSFQLRAASAALAVLGTLAVVTLVLPNYTVSTLGPHYSPLQLGFVGAVTLALYLVFIFVQTIRHRDYFLDLPEEGEDDNDIAVVKPSGRIAILSLALLLVSLGAVVLLAKILSAPLDKAVAFAGLPHAFVGDCSDRAFARGCGLGSGRHQKPPAKQRQSCIGVRNCQYRIDDSGCRSGIVPS